MKKILAVLMAYVSFSSFIGEGVSYELKDLGTLDYKKSGAFSLNNYNHVVGIIKKEKNKSFNFLWTPEEGLTSLAKESFQPLFINNLNQIVGIYWTTKKPWLLPDYQEKQIICQNSEGSLIDNGAPTKWDLKILDTYRSPSFWDEKEFSILGFNDLGQILLINAEKNSEANKFAIYQEGNYHYYNSKTLNRVYGLNNRGEILGRIFTLKEGKTTAVTVIYNSETKTYVEVATDLQVINAKFNDEGQVTLIAKKGDNQQGYLWDSKNGLKELENFYPLFINNHQQIVGSFFTEKKIIFKLFDQGEFFNLNELAGLDQENSLWELTRVISINDQGVILGAGKFDGEEHALILTPTEE